MSENPWKGLARPKSTGAINARRVDAKAPWGFFWARDMDGRCLLVLSHSDESAPNDAMPALKGIEASVVDGEEDGENLLSLKLLNSEHQDIFYHLCLDIMQGTAKAASEKEAVKIAIARTWRWHHLLRGGSPGRLSQEEQKGLIGELVVLQKILLESVGCTDAVTAWLGPHGAPKDFEIGRVCIESKARRGGAVPHVSISSEHQLDESGCDMLFLHVVELDRAPSTATDGLSLTEFADRVRDQLESGDPAAIGPYEAALAAGGFNWEDDYSTEKWIEGPRSVYRVTGDFPRIVATDVPGGVANIRYAVALPQCEPFLIDETVVTQALTGEQHVN